MRMKSLSLTKKERILKRSDFININRHGRRIRTQNFTLIEQPNGGDITRLGITVSKKVGNSVKRNRLKRLIREFFRNHKHQIPTGYDIVIIPLQTIEEPDFSAICEELSNALVQE
ncbi:MAG: ribonuclease P protein component [Thermodesulfobacteriota bacterium]